MKNKSNELKSIRFLLCLPQQQIQTQYPAIGQSWYKFIKHNNKIQSRKNNIVRLEYIMLYKNSPQELITYKAIKIQRLLSILAKLTKQLVYFQPVEEILRVQNCKQSSKKQIMIQRKTEQFFIQNKQYLLKGQNHLQYMVKNYNSLLIILKVKRSEHEQLSLYQFFSFFLVNKKKQFQNDQQQREIIIKKKLSVYLKNQLIKKIKEFTSKFEQTFKQTINKLKKLSEQNQYISQFLMGNNKFFKLQNFQNLSFPSINQQKSVRKNNLNKICGSIISVYVQLAKDIRSFQYFEQNIQNCNAFQLIFNWNLQSIQDTCLNLQYIYHYLYLSKSNQFQFKNQQQSKQNYQEGLQSLTKKFINWNINNLLRNCKQILECYLQQKQLISIPLQLGITFNQNIFNLPKQKMDSQSDQQGKGWFLQRNNDYKAQQSTRHSDDSTTKPQNQLINASILRQQHLRVYSEVQTMLFKKQHEYKLSISQSRDLISGFYRHYFLTIYSFIQCEKQWFFKIQKNQNNNVRLHCQTYMQWIPLVHQQGKNITKNIQFEKINSFTNYITNMVNTLILIKNAHLLYKIRKNRLRQEFQQFVYPSDRRQVQEQMIEQSIIPQNPGFFLYNDIQNILIYSNLSFENIDHCHYYLKNIKNDTRSEFQDRSWVYLLPNQSINLLIKQSKKIKNSQKSRINPNFMQQQQTCVQRKQTDKEINRVLFSNRSIISIPVRGRYCKHTDFFDLRQIYQKIFPLPFCQPNEIQCPKCMVQIPFDQLIYLKQVEVLIQMIKIFYLQNIDQIKQFCVPKKQFIKKKSVSIQNYYQKFQRLLKRDNKLLQQPLESYFVLKQLKLELNHPKQKIKLKGKYIIRPIQQFYKLHSKNSTNFQNSANQATLSNQSKQSFQPKFYEQQQIQFQRNLDKQVYQTLINPNKKFKSPQKRIKRFLENYVTKKKIVKTNHYATKSLQFTSNREAYRKQQNKFRKKRRIQNFNEKSYKQIGFQSEMDQQARQYSSYQLQNQFNKSYRTQYKANNYSRYSQRQQTNSLEQGQLTIQEKISVVKLSLNNHWLLYQDLQKGTVAI